MLSAVAEVLVIPMHHCFAADPCRKCCWRQHCTLTPSTAPLPCHECTAASCPDAAMVHHAEC